MKKIVCSALFLCLSLLCIAQKATDFTVTDSDGVEHTLYASHLDKNQTVVIELFFVQCPPCQATAPKAQKVYEAWGSGKADVEFIKLSTNNSNTNADVAVFKTRFGSKFPGVGFDGGAAAARKQFSDGTFGPYYGTPQFDVIAPDGSVTHGVTIDKLSDAIKATGATGMITDDPTDNPTDTTDTDNPTTPMDTVPTYTEVGIKHKIENVSAPTEIQYILTESDNSKSYNITELTNGTNQFQYPSDDFPKLDDPIVRATVKGPLKDNAVKATDLLVLLRHVLEIKLLPDAPRLLAGDLNNDKKVNARDLQLLNKVVLESIDTLPNDTPNWKSYPQFLRLVEDTGKTVELNFQFVKTGDVKY